jgi:hypothetical protein
VHVADLGGMRFFSPRAAFRHRKRLIVRIDTDQRNGSAEREPYSPEDGAVRIPAGPGLWWTSSMR